MHANLGDYLQIMFILVMHTHVQKNNELQTLADVALQSHKDKPDDPDWDEKRLYIDLIGDDETRKNDFHYLRHSWDYLLFKTNHFSSFCHIIVFSDGASKHFKSRFTMKYFANMTVECARTIVYQFFASYHGSGLWDAHFAHNNTAIRNFLIKMEGLRKKGQSKDFSPLAEIKQLVRVLMESLKDTVVYDVYRVDRDPSSKPDVKPIPFIKKYHTFKFIDSNHVDCSIMSGTSYTTPTQHQHTHAYTCTHTLSRVPTLAM